MAYVGYVINKHFCYDNVEETISKKWTFSGANEYTAKNIFKDEVEIQKAATLKSTLSVTDTTTLSGALIANGSITSSKTNNWTNTQTVSGAINSSGTNNWTGKNTFTQTIEGTAYSAQYGDVAEYFILNIDNNNQKEYNIKKYKGLLVELSDGDGEVIISKPNSRKSFGVVSENPALIINNKVSKEPTAVPVAYIGRVDCFVVGKVKKGDALTTSYVPGVAKKKTFLDKLLRKPTVGYALEDKIQEFNYQIEILIR